MRREKSSSPIPHNRIWKVGFKGLSKLSSKSGETLVEVLAAAAIFLLMMSIMQGAISFCTNAQHKSQAIRNNNAQICKNLRDGSVPVTSGGGTATYSFQAVASDGNPGGSVLFKIEAGLGKKEVLYEDESGTDQTVTFYLFQPTVTPGGGGGGP